MNYEIRVEGLNELIAKLGRATAQETLEDPMYRGALFLQAWSQKYRFIHGGGKASGKGDVQPDILTSRTGRLRGSITVSRSSQRSKFEFLIGTNVEYARQHEFGGVFNRVSSRGKPFIAKYPARPFLRPAIENENNINRITDSINKAIQEAFIQ